MSIYTLMVETTSNSTAGSAGTSTAIQALAASGRDLRLIATFVEQEMTAAGETPGRWVLDRISATSAGSSATPCPMDPLSAASTIANTSQCISTTLACAGTGVSAQSPCYEVPDLVGWQYIPATVNIRAGASQGFAMRRATAPTGARVVRVGLMWEEI
jgi:hypothetical protein